MLPVQSFPPWHPGAFNSPFSRRFGVDVGRFRHGVLVPKGAWIISTGSNIVQMATAPLRRRGAPEPERCGCSPCRCGCCRPPEQRPIYAYTGVRAYTNDDFVKGRPFFNREVWGPGWGRITLAGPCQTAPLILSDGWNVRIVGCGRARLMQAFSV